MNRFLVSSLSCLLLASLGACGSASAPTAQPTAATSTAETPADEPLAIPDLRQEDPAVLPTHYKVRLRLDPAEEVFRGELESTVNVLRETREFFLNGYGLKVSEATIWIGEKQYSLRAEAADEHWLRFVSDVPLPAGEGRLGVAYEGVVSSDSSFGIFRQEAAGDWYVYTQFEARGARRAFPSFDQPDLKVPWQVSLEVPEGLVALSNTPELRRVLLGDGFDRVTFEESKPLPSYLVAFAVGPFDMVDIGKTRSGVPMRVAAPKGRGGETGWVKESTARLVEILEDYTGIPYPYAKLDLVSVPATGSFSAMENPGLITYTERLLLSKDNDLEFKKSYASVGAHELAHQWFGNLVTNAWWNDLWLNESFATWAAAKVVREFNPKWRSDVYWMGRKDGAMQSDQLSTARIIHQPIETEGDIGAAFDGITYAKGASVLAMFEGWLGEETFQRGIQHYLGNNQWKSIRAADFLKAMDEGTSKNVSEPFATFIDKPGTPLVSFALQCEAGKTPSLTLSHERYKPLGSKVEVSPEYRVPVCVRYPTKGKETARVCALADASGTALPLEGAQRCPEWVIPNAGGTGYYRSKLPESLLAALQKKAPRTVSESLALASDLGALVRAGHAPLSLLIKEVESLAKSKDAGLVQTAVALADLSAYVSGEDVPRYQKWIRKNFSQTGKRLGWKVKRNEPADVVALRNAVLELLIFEGGETKLGAEGLALAKRWLDKPSSVHPDVAGLALRVGAHMGDAALLDRYVEAIKATSDRSRRRLLLAGLASATKPELIQRSLQVMLDPSIGVRESQRTLRTLAAHPEHGHLAMEFLSKNFAELRARYGEGLETRLARVASLQCDAQGSASVKAFLTEKIATMDGGKRAAEQALEAHELCLAGKAGIELPAKF